MSPFQLADGEWVSCTSAGYAHPFEHAANCPCPCPMCIRMFTPVLEEMKLLDRARAMRHLYVVAFDRLLVSDDVPEDDSWTGLHHAMYSALSHETGMAERMPTATIGRLLEDSGGALLDVRVPSDPYPERADELLADFAAANEITIRLALEPAEGGFPQ